VLPYSYRTPPVADAETMAVCCCICKGISISTSHTASPLLSGVVKNAKRDMVALTSGNDENPTSTSIDKVLRLMVGVNTKTSDSIVLVRRLLAVGPVLISGCCPGILRTNNHVSVSMPCCSNLDLAPLFKLSVRRRSTDGRVSSCSFCVAVSKTELGPRMGLLDFTLSPPFPATIEW